MKKYIDCWDMPEDVRRKFIDRYSDIPEYCNGTLIEYTQGDIYVVDKWLIEEIGLKENFYEIDIKYHW